MNLIFSSSRMGRTVALTKMIFFLNKLSIAIEAKTPTTPCEWFFMSAVFILAVDLK